MLQWVRNRRERACRAVQEAHGLRLRFGADAEDWCESAIAAVGHDPEKIRFLRLVRQALRRLPCGSGPRGLLIRAPGGLQ